jgi:hypothetical protein
MFNGLQPTVEANTEKFEMRISKPPRRITVNLLRGALLDKVMWLITHLP